MKQFLKSLLAGLGYEIRGTRYTPRQLRDPAKLRLLTFDDAVCRYMFDHGPQLTFVQVGVFDGVTHDPLRKFIVKNNWDGVLVEPQSRAVEKLRELYSGNDRVQIVHAALSPKKGRSPFFTIESDTAPAWSGGLASFDRETIFKHREQIPGIESMIREEMVDCVPFDDVLSRLSRTPDILQIDTEGADALVLSLFPFERVRPPLVHWEVKHLTVTQREEVLDRLGGFGYRFASSGDEDMLALNF